jgi:hypothetical protein
MLGNDRGELRLERLERLASAEFAPRLQVHAAHLIAILAGEERHGVI